MIKDEARCDVCGKYIGEQPAVWETGHLMHLDFCYDIHKVYERNRQKELAAERKLALSDENIGDESLQGDIFLQENYDESYTGE